MKATSTLTAAALALLLTTFVACGDDDDEEAEETTTTTSTPTPTSTALMLVWSNTGRSNDVFTTAQTVAITAEAGARITLTVMTNETNHEPTEDPDPIDMSEADEVADSTKRTTNLNLFDYFSELEEPTGIASLPIKLTASAVESGKTATTESVELTLVEAMEDDAVTLALEDDTGTDMDLVTTNSRVVIGGTKPRSATLSFVVTTNSKAHILTTPLALSQTSGLDLVSYLGILEVSITSTLSRHGHEVTTNLTYTFLPWPSVGATYRDTGNGNDGLTTDSELTMTGFDSDLPSPFAFGDFRLVGYVLSNSGNEPSSTPSSTEETANQALSDGYTIDMRDLKATLGQGESIHSVTFDYSNTGHEEEIVFNPPLTYVPEIGTFDRKFNVANHSMAIAITSTGTLVVTSSNSSNSGLYFYDTNGNDATIASVSNFASHGNATNQLNTPIDVAVDDANKIYVAEYSFANKRVKVFEADLSFDTNITLPTTAIRVAFHNGYLYASSIHGGDTNFFTYDVDELGSRLSNLAADAKALGVAGDGVHHALRETTDNTKHDRVEAWTGSPTNGFEARTGHHYSLRVGRNLASRSTPWDIVVGPITGRIYISDSVRQQVVVLRYDGGASTNQYRLVGTFGRGHMSSGSGDGQFNNPVGMLIHGGELYVVDNDNNRVQVFDVPE